MRVLVTGASGYLGRRMIPQLLEAGHEVRAFVRSTSNVGGLPENIEIVEGDVLDPNSLEQAVQDMEVCVHLAAYFDFYPKDVDLLYRTNVEGTKNTIGACVGSSVKRFIYCSSTEAIGPVKYPPGNEDTQPNPTFDYGKSKVLAEDVVREIAGDTGLEHIILRPTGILGEGEFYVAYQTIKAFNDGQIKFIPGDGEKRIMFTYVDDVVSGFLAALTHISAVNNTYILCPNYPMKYSDLFTFLGRLLGVKPPSRKIPLSAAKLAVSMMKPFKNRGGKSFIWHPQSIQSMDEHRWYTNERAKTILGWSPKYTMEEALTKVVEWCLANGYLKKKG